MKKNLMYGVAPDYNGWDETNALVGNKIEEDIVDTVNQNAKKTRIPKVSIPSPFARFELVQKAFVNVAKFGNGADMRDKILVSHALDAIQLFYENESEIEVIPWQKNASIQELKNSGYRSHKLVGDILKLYMRQEDYGFNERNHYAVTGNVPDDMTVYFLTYNKSAVAVTSPTSIFMASPRYQDFTNELTIDSGKPIFSSIRPMLYERDEFFIEYLYRLVRYMELTCRGREEQVLKSLQGFRDYLAHQKVLIRQYNPQLFRNLNDIATANVENLMENYSESAPAIYLLGIELYVRRRENVKAQIGDTSDFVINSSRSKRKTLVLTNNFSAPGWIYTSKNTIWDINKHAIDYGTVRFDNKFLPGTQTEYEDGWICEHDIFSDVIVELPYAIDKTRYFDGNLTGADNISFLLPIKKRFFEYFPLEYLQQKDGKDSVFKIEVRTRKKSDNKGEDEKDVVVTLRIPVVNGRTITLKKTYIYNESPTEGLVSFPPDSPAEARGYVVQTPTEISIFPFVKMKENRDNRFIIQVMRFGWDNYEGNLTAYRSRSFSVEEHDVAVSWDGIEAKRPSKSTYYTLKDGFDYLMLNIEDVSRPGAKLRDNTALIYPLMPLYQPGNIRLRFAFDFGTSNSHIAVREADGEERFLNFKVENSVGSTLQKDFNRVANMALNMFDLRYKQEFLPKEGIGINYSFPSSTVLLVPNMLRSTNNVRAFREANIPFIYGKEDYNDSENSAITNLKWSDDDKQSYARAFIEELVLLARAFAIENRADLKNCQFTWTYPLSMSKRDVEEFQEIWINFYREYFNSNVDAAEDNVKSMTESIAPILYYRDNKIAIEEFNLSIDIGGGTCDVVLYLSKDNQRITSFRFGADNIFGVGTNQDIDMIRKGFDYFIKKFADLTRNPDAPIVKELIRFSKKTASASEANGRLFGLESHRLIKKLAEEDKSYNLWLSKRKEYRLIFIYYYAAIIYYLTKMLIANDFDTKPAALFFSGTGSKLLNIIGRNNHLRDITSTLIEAFSNGKFRYEDDPVAVTIEKNEPKQLTAKGALFVNDLANDISQRVNRFRKKMMMSHPMSETVESENQGLDEKSTLRYEHLKNEKVLAEIVDKVADFNSVFCCIMEKNTEDFGLDENILAEFKRRYVINSEAKTKLMAFMKTGLSQRVKDKDIITHPDREFEDAPFFYPIKEIIEKLLKTES